MCPWAATAESTVGIAPVSTRPARGTLGPAQQHATQQRTQEIQTSTAATKMKPKAWRTPGGGSSKASHQSMTHMLTDALISYCPRDDPGRLVIRDHTGGNGDSLSVVCDGREGLLGLRWLRALRLQGRPKRLGAGRAHGHAGHRIGAVLLLVHEHREATMFRGSRRDGDASAPGLRYQPSVVGSVPADHESHDDEGGAGEEGRDRDAH
eukprot:CAMPEP_0176020266 /NCGR_PEP_ID=MMETSP0120_2-20121206/9813_1 /TAXON_ID=160619 /ORGANISM="Kryptoperidinium foliaceum, Strain CCMP 1326" /LENGTH=207 /DNA_ID=CAMNT_0017353359 /DNA_START=20 /DNA_END=640 /DNA_ORIENTATION=-